MIFKNDYSFNDIFQISIYYLCIYDIAIMYADYMENKKQECYINCLFIIFYSVSKHMRHQTNFLVLLKTRNKIASHFIMHLINYIITGIDTFVSW